MLKRLSTALFVALLFSGFIFAQSQGVEVQKMKVADENQQTETMYLGDLNQGNKTYGVAEEIATTKYDYFSNSVVRDQITWYDGTPHLANMVQGWDGDPELRMVVYSTFDGTNWVQYPTSTTRRGWPQIDVSLTGSVPGQIGIVDHVPCNLNLFDGVGGFITSDFDPSSDPSLQFSGDAIFTASSGDRLQFQFFETMDFGATFNNWDSISSFSPNPIFWLLNGGVEVGMSKSQDEQNVIHFGTNANGGHVVEGVSPDSADNLWMIKSEDGGANWTGVEIADDGVLDLVPGYHTTGFAPLFENFGQVDAAITNDGVTHFVANGYGLVYEAGVAVANSFPVLYWNSANDEWMSLSDEAIDTIQTIGDLYPTNSIGQAYPSVSVSEDGQIIYVMWTGPQLTGTGELDTADNGAGTPYYWRDQYHAYSDDGGDTWEYLGVMPDMMTDRSECFGHAAQHLEEVSPGTYRAHIVYISDLTTGVGPFDAVLTDNPIIYTTYDITTTSVDDNENNTVNSFELAQNYPNPFNPTTSISYTLAERSNVNLTVYDMLGREVATLVNSTKDAGSYEVNFDASNLASGLYVYTLKAGNFTSTKKMMLMK